MSSDRARISYDEYRQYRAVVMQQGRVTVEADWNEAQQIVNEEIRKETLDFVGSSGTPDKGYAIDLTGQPMQLPFDFSVCPGTMYVGGLRAFLTHYIKYSVQQDWLDCSTDLDWVDLSAKSSIYNELIYLYLREQEVSAVEDSDLREVALGGPDTAQRLRLIQRIKRLSTEAQDCNDAMTIAAKKWETEGLHFDPHTMRLESWSTLKASFQDLGSSVGSSNPQANGGYLGADNQLIRVQISGSNKLLWGFDNASFIYRVDTKDGQTLHFQKRPVDASHQPKTNQVVEVLRSAAQLSNGNYIASATGKFFKLTVSYDSDTQSLKLPATDTDGKALPTAYWDQQQTPQIFLRVWQDELPFTPSMAVALGDTGLQVTLQTTSEGKLFHVGDYWSIAVRPSTSCEVYPHRYLVDFQPPDGPRLWVCPLAVIERVIEICGGKGTGTIKLLESYQNHFDNLVKISISDKILNKTLQDILNQHQNILDQYKKTFTLSVISLIFSFLAILVCGLGFWR
ncbi:DUF6519 domain-containing protein [uncultured Nostoc sp.]|uniref:DUF6519 domain-containing protein n=1 Tax=uncultured Nostoc sp. TaxID=340711 RepID=UPI0035CA7178